MQKLRVAIAGYGNIGKYALQAVLAAGDMEAAGIIRRKADTNEVMGVPVADDVSKLGKVDTVLLCIPSRNVGQVAESYLRMGINTVDSFDIHPEIWELKQALGIAAKASGSVAVVSAGWDPGSDSVIRAIMQACAPKGITDTNFGPGMSMGHTVAAKAVEGVGDALSMTIPAGTGIHRRKVYVQLEPGADFSAVAARIKADPYFVNDETTVVMVDDISLYLDRGHGVNLVRRGVSGMTDNQFFEFNMRVNNPALTSQIMVACARAGARQQPGAYTMVELPPVDLLEGGKEGWIKKLV